jgi:hypothetical protein
LKDLKILLSAYLRKLPIPFIIKARGCILQGHEQYLATVNFFRFNELLGVSKKMLIKACHILFYAPSSEDTLRKEHGHGQAPEQLYQMTRYQPYRKKLWSKHNCLKRGKWGRDQKRSKNV